MLLGQVNVINGTSSRMLFTLSMIYCCHYYRHGYRKQSLHVMVHDGIHYSQRLEMRFTRVATLFQTISEGQIGFHFPSMRRARSLGMRCTIIDILCIIVRYRYATSALLQLHLRSRLNTWLKLIGQRQLQDKTRNIKVLFFDAAYTIGLRVCFNMLCCVCEYCSR